VGTLMLRLVVWLYYFDVLDQGRSHSVKFFQFENDNDGKKPLSKQFQSHQPLTLLVVFLFLLQVPQHH